MKEYSNEFKDKVIARLFPPHNISVAKMSEETGVPRDTLYGWRTRYRKDQPTVPDDAGSNGLSSDDKFHVVIETSSLNEVELSEYCRRKGFYPEQVKGWRTACIEANELRPVKAERENNRRQVRKIKELESELNRKEKALAEAAALLILKKKLHTLWEGPEGAKLRSESDET